MNIVSFVGFDVLTAVAVNGCIFWDITPYSSVKSLCH
jgi:hypothetical protein